MTDILLLGEYLNEEEAETGESFTGKSGWLYGQLLAQVGIDIKSTARLSVLNLPGASEYTFTGDKASGIAPVLNKGKYIRKEFAQELEKTRAKIAKIAPSVIIAAGPLASWFTLGTYATKSIRGATAKSLQGPKVIVTHSPKEIFRDWTLRPIVLSDMAKALRESASPTLTRPAREIWINPTLDDLSTFHRKYIADADQLSIDIETASDQITCIGFAPSPAVALVVPFTCHNSTGNNYWATQADELAAWNWVRLWCEWPAVFQNGLYDVQFLWRRYGIAVPQMQDDTMLLHHAMQPEMNKGLGFLATIYSDESSWKFMRKTKHD